MRKPDCQHAIAIDHGAVTCALGYFAGQPHVGTCNACLAGTVDPAEYPSIDMDAVERLVQAPKRIRKRIRRQLPRWVRARLKACDPATCGQVDCLLKQEGCKGCARRNHLEIRDFSCLDKRFDLETCYPASPPAMP